MALIRYISHPNVEIDPDVPVPEWGLNDVGRARALALSRQPWAATIERIISSDETKAVETARILGQHIGVDVEIRDGLGENDRSATGFVPPERFEQLADAFFAEPDQSVHGWERAIDAQRRIVHGLADLVAPDPVAAEGSGDVAVIGHGGVGTLWLCHLSGHPIDRRHDQPGQGHHFTVDRATAGVLHPWLPIEQAEPD